MSVCNSVWYCGIGNPTTFYRLASNMFLFVYISAVIVHVIQNLELSAVLLDVWDAKPAAKLGE